MTKNEILTAVTAYKDRPNFLELLSDYLDSLSYSAELHDCVIVADDTVKLFDGFKGYKAESDDFEKYFSPVFYKAFEGKGRLFQDPLEVTASVIENSIAYLWGEEAKDFWDYAYYAGFICAFYTAGLMTEDEAKFYFDKSERYVDNYDTKYFIENLKVFKHFSL